MNHGTARDQVAYEQRTAGRSYGVIARELGYESAPAATAAFLRVLASQPADLRPGATQAEHDRLDALGAHVESDPELTAEARARRLAVIRRMHDAVDAGAPGGADCR